MKAVIGRGEQIDGDGHEPQNYLYSDQGNDNLFQSLGMSTGYGFFEKLEHILQYINAAIQNLQALG